MAVRDFGGAKATHLSPHSFFPLPSTGLPPKPKHQYSPPLFTTLPVGLCDHQPVSYTPPRSCVRALLPLGSFCEAKWEISAELSANMGSRGLSDPPLAWQKMSSWRGLLFTFRAPVALWTSWIRVPDGRTQDAMNAWFLWGGGRQGGKKY